MESYYYNSSTILRYLRKVLNEIHKDYVDSGLRAGFIMKRFAQKYKLNSEIAVRLVLLCMLQDIGCFYQDGNIPKDNPALSAASARNTARAALLKKSTTRWSLIIHTARAAASAPPSAQKRPSILCWKLTA